jgi:peptide-methionine (S)-S-oxide reductase
MSVRYAAAIATTLAFISLATTAPPSSGQPALGAPARDTATFAGGCFWSMERPFQHVPGVIATTVGYTGGHTSNPSYQDVGTRTTGHAESVEVIFDPSRVSYQKLLDVYWHNIDPFAREAQFCDHGNEYRTAIFYHGEAQRAAAEASKRTLEQSAQFKESIPTQVVPASTFWKAEDYHQHFADRNPQYYAAYRRGCGRDARLRQIWGDSAGPYVPKD